MELTALVLLLSMPSLYRNSILSLVGMNTSPQRHYLHWTVSTSTAALELQAWASAFWQAARHGMFIPAAQKAVTLLVPPPERSLQD